MRLRARKEQDKTERRRAILDAALAAWSRSSYGELTMSAVAERAGLVKGTLYLYFATKEELLLELLEELLGEWLDEIGRSLQRRRGLWTAEDLAGLVSRSLEGRDALIRLLTTSGGIFEHNISDDRARRYKETLRTRIIRMGGLLAERVPHVGLEGAMRFLFQVYALLTGFGEMAYPAPVARRVMQEPGFEMFRIDVAREIGAAVLTLLRGLEAEHPPKAPARRKAHRPARATSGRR